MIDDLINRADAIDAIHCDISVVGRQNAEIVAMTIGQFVDRIKAIPSAQPKQGEWIDTSSGEHWKCSACGCRASYFWIDTNRAIEWLSEFCPNCGAKMEVEND